MSNSFMHSCISISFVDASAHIKFVGIHWYDTVLPSISCSFRSCITFLNDFLSTYFIELIDSHVPAQSFNKFIGILCSYPPNIKVSIYFAANIASSNIFLKIKALVSFDKWHTLSIIFNFQYIGLVLVISLFVQVHYCGRLCQLELVSIENRQKNLNKKPNTSPLDVKLTATNVCIRMKIALVPNKIFQKMIKKQNKIIINEQRWKPKNYK